MSFTRGLLMGVVVSILLAATASAQLPNPYGAPITGENAQPRERKFVSSHLEEAHWALS